MVDGMQGGNECCGNLWQVVLGGAKSERSEVLAASILRLVRVRARSTPGVRCPVGEPTGEKLLCIAADIGRQEGEAQAVRGRRGEVEVQGEVNGSWPKRGRPG